MRRALAVVLCLVLFISSFSTSLFSGVFASTQNSDFYNTSNWVRYSFDTAYINSENGKSPTWGSVTTNTNTAYTYGGDASSIKISAKLQLSTFEFQVEANKDYIRAISKFYLFGYY